ncbi:phosphoribosylanthranilate isomerase [Bacillus niacini]|uniref:Flagellar protein FliT n=1 Tax=Neobacillus niacini TaxID=86668 RepID=A0A852TFC6_9BACI|nr:flagellar protein FliT [Neobacillus niacini]NYE06755.1 phosphoribosylanthranilate isomerase [Neobacillus niacini]
MDELIEDMYETTVQMHKALMEENIEEFEELLSKRNEMMIAVDERKANYSDYMYSAKAKTIFEEIILIDQQITSLVQNEKDKNQLSLNQLKNNKQVSKKYQPYSKQTYGVFVDKSK